MSVMFCVSFLLASSFCFTSFCVVTVACCKSLYLAFYVCFFFFFKQKTPYEMRISDWSSDVCSSDLARFRRAAGFTRAQAAVHGHRLRTVFAQVDRSQAIVRAQRVRRVAVVVCAQANALRVPFDDLVPQAHRALVRDEGEDLVAVDHGIGESGMARNCRSGGSRDARGSWSCGRSRLPPLLTAGCRMARDKPRHHATAHHPPA